MSMGAVETEWVVSSLSDSVGESQQVIRDVYARHAQEVAAPGSGVVDANVAFSVLDAIKRHEPGLIAVAASTLKVRMMILLQSRRELRL